MAKSDQNAKLFGLILFVFKPMDNGDIYSIYIKCWILNEIKDADPCVGDKLPAL